ncbi:hypothetical protein Patl1_17114 [Pistacia atlantica]|uniref:Uncharacterized protein n=1 Tax=Pistacia atlantica TaxID=434234 RepID=A0ACC1B6U5_9ROSI|nr:hypothetical protein Patl1_17114 [Pistacia atlantica]
MLISLQGWRMEGCLEQERFALLQLKHFFNNPNRLQDWKSGIRGVVPKCFFAFSLPRIGDTLLNGNLIAGCVENEGFERLSHLDNLVDLDLSYNMFNDSRILPGLSKHSSLKHLSLAYNQFGELNHFNVSGLSNLEKLSLSGNMFNNNNILSYVSTLSSLTELNLIDIGLKGTVDLQELDSLSCLEALHMGGIEIKKIVISKGETSLGNLTRLYLSTMNISDGRSLLQTLGLFPSLMAVEIRYNNFRGAVTTYELNNVTNVKEFRIYDSTLHISFLQSIGAFMSLESLRMDDCEVSGVLTDQELRSFKNLKTFWMYGIVFHNNFFQVIAAMTSVQTITILSSNISETLLDQG